MRRNADRTSHWVKREVVKRVKKLAKERNHKTYTAVAVFVDSFVRGMRAGRVQLPPPVPLLLRSQEVMVTITKDQNKDLGMLAVEHEASIKFLLRAALEQGLEAEAAQPGVLLQALELTERHTKPVQHDADLVDVLKDIAATRGTSLMGLTDAVLRVVAANPGVLDSIELPPAREYPASEAVEAASKRAVDLAVSRPGSASKKTTHHSPKSTRTRAR